MCKVLKFPRSTYYVVINHKPSRREIEYKEFNDKVKHFYDKSKGRYGSARLQKDIAEDGTDCTVKRVQHHMKVLGIRSIVTRKYQYQMNQGKIPGDKDNFLNRHFEADTVCQKLVTDITYIHVFNEGWTYLASVMDLYDHKIIGWAYGKKITAELAKKAVENACLNIDDTSGIILHSELGSQYTSTEFDKYIKSKGMTHSYTRKGKPYDNACIESFHSVLKKKKSIQNRTQHFKRPIHPSLNI